MANSITLAQKYLPMLDEVYKKESLTSRLDMTGARINWVGAKTALIYKTSLSGLGDYNRNTGYVQGDVTGTWESFTPAIDRGRSFWVDAMDNEETMNMAFGVLAGEFMRTCVIPEVDAYRFSKYAGLSGISTGTPVDVSSNTNVLSLIDEAQRNMDDNEVPTEGRICFVSNEVYYQLKDRLTRYIQNNEMNVNRNVEMLDDLEIVKVPSGRFNTGVNLLDGTTGGEELGGFTVPNGTYGINFMIIHPSAVVQITKHALPRIFSPLENQRANAYQFDYRIYHDAFGMDNKLKGIYLNRRATAKA